jgi:uncharacterized repeat protein (TIGR02543 family)
MGVDLSGAEVQPPDATNKDIEWKVTSGPGVITGSKLTATSAGDVELTATIANGTAQGTAFIKTFTFQFKALDPNQRVVSFNAHGGAPAPEAQAVDVNGHAVKPADMKKTGYDFGGWFTKNGEANDWGNEWNFAADAVTDHIELYAKWTPASYQIAYHLDGGTNDAANPAGYTIESETITLKDPARNGYRFGGWYEKDDWSGSAVISIPKGSHGNKTFYARWIPSTGNINITFAGPEDEAITLGDNQTLSWAANDSLTITAPTGYASYQWLVDGMVDESVTGNEFAKDARDFTIKRHTVTVRVKTAGGRWYSKETTFTVSR